MKTSPKTTEPKPALLVVLEVTSWVGTSIGATHTYGRLVWYEGEEREEDKLRHPMSAKDAAVYNKEMQEQGYSSLRKKPGDMSEDFRDKGEVIEAAKKEALARWKGEAFVIVGSMGTLSAQPVICWPERFKSEAERMTVLAEEWEFIGGYEGNEKRADEIDEEWYTLYKKVGGK